MPIVILEGPEAAGKTTIIEKLLASWGENSRVRSWGPRDSWLEYCGPLFEDTKACQEDPLLLIVWSRSWLSRAVYNTLLKQGQDVPPRAMTELDRIVLSNGGLLILVTAPPSILQERRERRLAEGSDQKDHPLNPRTELNEFLAQSRKRKWWTISGTRSPEDNVSSIITMLVQRNPESRMNLRKEETSSQEALAVV